MPSERCANLGEALALCADEPLMFRPGAEVSRLRRLERLGETPSTATRMFAGC